MTGSRSLLFAESVRVLNHVTRQHGLTVPTVRCPPQDPERDRTIRRRPDGDFTMAVRLTGRPFAAVLADLIDGILFVNGIDAGLEAETIRRDMWNAIAAGPAFGIDPE